MSDFQSGVSLTHNPVVVASVASAVPQAPCCTSKMSKLDLPTFSGPIEPTMINAWLGRCEDSYLAWSAWNPGHTISPQILIILAGLQLEEPSARLWWNQNRDVLKQLATWEAFASRFQDHFTLSGWYLDALARFYNVSQDFDDFRTFVASLRAARNTLGSAGDGYTISDSIFKNHLFFFANPVLQLRVRAIPNFAYGNLKVEALINIMETMWSSLVAEGFTMPAPKPMLMSTSTAPVSNAHSLNSTYPLPDLTYAEREVLRSAGGCFHCRLSPSDLAWKPHVARECPGDEQRSIPPRAPRPIAAVILPKVLITHDNPGVTGISNPKDGTITAILPPVVVRRPSYFDDSDSDED
ncbi:hypothetical protein DEU56DRAFT_818094 [Suillus clintonianus]|uniref:uncharacterized protein n=1 Tax=Suillus clintonianus TaxID=1904413 RepID=UPI001B885AF2|nr:uncharacterized protein DEU56DRAFT_818094 [Suillus clintonianus]KAG2129156.1 hypothetical protein DEU56DRAFT_818094 [Suillus clintonianus]